MDRDFKDLPTGILITVLSKAEDQREINILAYELACRTYIPCTDTSFENVVRSFGWKPIEEIEEKTRQKIR